MHKIVSLNNPTPWVLAASLTLLASAATADAHIELKDWTDKPGVKLVLVEFYSETGQELLKAHGDRGLVVLHVRGKPGDTACEPLGWAPDAAYCDNDGSLAAQFGVTDMQPAAFLWSWQGSRLGSDNHTVTDTVDAYMKAAPSIRIVAQGPVLGVLEAALAAPGKLNLRKTTQLKHVRLNGGKCTPGAELPADSRLFATVQNGQLTLKLRAADSGCEHAPITVPWVQGDPERSVNAAVAALTAMLTRPVETPGAPAPPRGRLTVRTDPPGVDLLLDGESIGRDPNQLRIAPGKHTLTAVSRCHAKHEQAFEVGAGDHKALDITLATLEAKVMVKALNARKKPLKGDVLVHGVTVGKTGVVLTVPFCTTRVTVSNHKTGDAHRGVSLSQKKTTEVTVRYYSVGAPKKIGVRKHKKGDRKDYWGAIAFNRGAFEDVQTYVKTYYIDGNIDRARALSEGANFAMLEGEPAYEVLPVAFYEARTGLTDEDGRLGGPTYKLDPADKFLLHRVPDPVDSNRLDLTDDEIRERRAKAKARRQLLEDTWTAARFVDSDFDRVMRYIEKRAPQKEHKRFWLAASQGFLYSLDPHSSLVSAKAWDDATKETTDSSFQGIGAILTQRKGKTLVENPLYGRPAHKAGLRAGDTIRKVDSTDITGMSLQRVVDRIRGPKGTKVVLSVRRVGAAEDLKIVIVRAQIAVKNVSERVILNHDRLGYIKVNGFVPTTVSEVKASLARLEASTGGLKGLVLDLRGNSGGLLQQAIRLSDLFLSKGRVVVVKNRVREDEYYSATRRQTYGGPLVVLTNHGSASASEIVAAAVRGNNRGLVIGDRSFGKASVQTLLTPILRKDYYIKLTIARYYSPPDWTVQAVGIKPDLPIPPELGKKMPLGFREENISGALSPLKGKRPTAYPGLADIRRCIARKGTAEALAKDNPNPELKFDFQLMKAADALNCQATKWHAAR